MNVTGYISCVAALTADLSRLTLSQDKPSRKRFRNTQSRVELMSAMGHKQTSASAMSALPPITDVGRRIQASIWLSVYECGPSSIARVAGYDADVAVELGVSDLARMAKQLVRTEQLLWV